MPVRNSVKTICKYEDRLGWEGEGTRQTYFPKDVETGDVGAELENIKLSL